MTSVKLIICLFGVIWMKLANGTEHQIHLIGKFAIQYSDELAGLYLISKNDSQVEMIANLTPELNEYHTSIEKTSGIIKFTFPNDVMLKVTVEESLDDYVSIEIYMTANQSQRLSNCFLLGEDNWYGGPQQKHQYWPIEKLVLSEYSYLPKEADNAAITEPYWLSSSGLMIYIHPTVPLFVDQNSLYNDSVCFIAEVKPPYSTRRAKNVLAFTIVWTDNARKTHEYAVKHFLKKPSGRPDRRMVQHPIWSTWAEYKRPINESVVMEFAEKIIEYGFNNSQLEIDDLWETCYGSFNVDEEKFPDLRNFNLKLKEMGFRVTFWIHPFINKDCEPWYSEALQKGYLVKNEDGKVDTAWWNSDGPTAAYVDFTNESAKKWWSDRLKHLQTTYAIDSFKFDAGETSWSPQVPVQMGDVNTQPSHITQKYVEECATFGPMVEVRAGQRTQELPIFVRMIDKDSEWNFENGLPTLVTTLLQMNMNGYPLVLPDMIGGNGYNEPPPKEMFIRWLQANTFMPSLQYSYVPWDYDNETIEISRMFTDLHSDYTPKIIEAFDRAVEKGYPVNPPIWWIDPIDETALGIWDGSLEYLLGEDILVAPVLEEGSVTRDVYLPEGKWMAEGQNDKIYTGRLWIRNYSAPLNVLPYFIKMK